MIKKASLSIIGVVLLLGLILFQSGALDAGKIAPGLSDKADLSNYDKIKPEEKEVPEVFQTIGTIRSRNEIDIMPRIVARIIEVNYRSGDSVKKGDILASLDAQELEAVVSQTQEQFRAISASVSMANEQINAAKAAAELAKKEYDRTKALFEQGAVSKRNLDEAETAMKKAEAAKQSALQQKKSSSAQEAAMGHSIEQAKVGYKYASLVSPIDGIVAERISDPGDMANPSFAIMKLFDPKAMELEVPIPESLISQVGVGSKVTYTVDALKKTFNGVLKEIVPSVNTQTRTFLAKVNIEAQENLMPGMFGTVMIPLGKTQKSLYIPEELIIKTGQIESVMEEIGGYAVRSQIKTVPADIQSNGTKYRKVISGLSAASILLKSKH